ncbi:MAG: hypothetical protein OEM62_03440 [Acidobacteriota bacterium]|nr:hypothetical protein [Acidobacteriota bacterium]
MEESVNSKYSCPRCGAENLLVAGERFPVCAYCDNTLVVDRSGVVGHYRLPRLVDREQARKALNRWMSGNQTVKDLDRKSALQTLKPLTFPMWLFRSRQSGAETVFVEPAAPTPIPQLAELKVPAGRLEPFRKAGEGVETVAATIPLATARGWLSERGIETVTESSLVQVPLWRAHYRYENTEYQALIEGSTGSVMASVFPEKAESPYFLVALLGLVLFGIEGLLIGNLFAKFFVYAVTAVPLALLAFWVTRKV